MNINSSYKTERLTPAKTRINDDKPKLDQPDNNQLHKEIIGIMYIENSKEFLKKADHNSFLSHPKRINVPKCLKD